VKNSQVFVGAGSAEAEIFLFVMWRTWEACNPIRGLFLTDEV
jgi:hypothetical protein